MMTRARKEVFAEIGDADISFGELIARVWAKLNQTH
jgi:hypothetical protein